ncbi:MAG: glycolate oxidase subunit GlcD [Planctomycetota bacterium]|jgi:glycolate oxidase subunit GlcD
MNPTVVQSLRAILGDAGLVADKSRRIPYECDGLAFMRQVPALVLLPASTAETVACMRVLHEAKVPVVARGAGTGLTGGATPVEGGVVIGTARMRRVIEINERDSYARVEAGLVNVDLTKACEDRELIYAPDPSSQMACTIGGNVANNSGGPHCFKYGSTTRHILGLKIVTPEGELLDLSQAEVDAEGLDLVGLFVGSEGMFGIATEITVRLIPEPEIIETVLAIFPELDKACEAVTEIIAERWEPSALEIIDRLTIQAVEASIFAAGYPPEADAVLLIDIDGSRAECDVNYAGISKVLARHGVLDIRRAQSALERRKLWAGRKGAYGAMGRIAPDLYVSDVVVPRTKLRELVRRSTEICAEFGLKITNVFHAGDGNLHPNISYDRRDAEELKRVLDAANEIMRVVIDAGGTLSGEHGIGLEKRDQMHMYFTQADINLMFAVRAAWDRDERMNPGKLLPVRACNEHMPFKGLQG